MGLRTPAYLVKAGGQDVTRQIQDRLIEFRVTLTSDRASDALELDLSDLAGGLAIPASERELRVSLGYKDSGLVPMGVYYHDESELQLSPRRLTVRATAADFRGRSGLKAPKARSWDRVSLGHLVRTIAAEHGYIGRVGPGLAGIVVAHVDQTAESDLHLLRRLARQYDATAKAAGGYLIFAPRGSGRSAGSARPLPTIVLSTTDVLSARYTVKGRPRYGAVMASYQDVNTAELVHVKAGTDSPAYVIREPFPDRPQAQAAATARLSRLARQTRELAVSTPGNPALVSEAVVVMRDWPNASGSRWAVLRAEHTLSKQRGYITSVTAEPAENS